VFLKNASKECDYNFPAYKPPKPSAEPRDKQDCGCGQPDCWKYKEKPDPRSSKPRGMCDKNKQAFHELTGPVKYYADLFKTEEEIDHEVYESNEVEPQVGDFVKFKNFVERKSYNGKIGLIQKELNESQFTISTMNDATFFVISLENFDIIKNCNGVYQRIETGEMIWPKIKGFNVPSSHWVKDRTLTAMTMNLFEAIHYYEWDDYYTRFGYADTMPEKNKFKFKYGKRKGKLLANGPGKQGFLAPFTNLAYYCFRQSCHYNQAKPEIFPEFYSEYTERVKQLFGWTKPHMMRFATGSDEKANLYIVCYDEDSKAEINDWFEYTVVNDNLSREDSTFDLNRAYDDDCCGFEKDNLPVIRGPFIMIKPTMQFRKMFKREFLNQLTICACCRDKGNQDPRFEAMDPNEDQKEVWTGNAPFSKLNDTKLMYQRNRYLVPEILEKAKNKETPNYLLKAKTKYQETRSARDLIEKYACRTGDCVPCSKSLQTNTFFAELQKDGYKDVKAEMKTDDGSGDAKTRCMGCSRKVEGTSARMVPFLSTLGLPSSLQ
jgi:hypothetical protein